jgi:hypothetical protein
MKMAQVFRARDGAVTIKMNGWLQRPSSSQITTCTKNGIQNCPKCGF